MQEACTQLILVYKFLGIYSTVCPVSFLKYIRSAGVSYIQFGETPLSYYDIPRLIW